MKKLFLLLLLSMFLATARPAAAAPVISANGVVNNASFAPGVNALAPGTIAAIFGTGLNDGTRNPFSAFGSNGRLITTLGGASVTFNGFSAPMFSSFPGQLNVQIPLELAGSTTASAVVTVAGQQSAPVTVPIGPSSPGIFAINNGYGAILIANTSIFAAPGGSISGAQARPANPGEFISIFTTGLGAVTNPPATGQAASGQPTVTLPRVTIGGIPATVSFSGMSPGFVGLYQVNAQVPQGASGGGFATVALSIGGKQSNLVGMAVSGNGGGGGNFCQGFALQGTATSLTGTIPGICLFNGQLGSPVTGGVPVSLTGVTSASGTQTVYSGNLTGSGTGQCADGSTSNWTANISLAIRVNPTVTSLATNGGILNGNYNVPSGSLNFCGSIQNLGFLAASPAVTGSVSAGGATTINIGGPIGLPPVVLRGNAQSVNGPLFGVTVTSLLFNNFSGTSAVSISATGASSGGQTVYTGTGAGGGLVQCGTDSGTWTATASSFTATVSPAVPSLATSGGTVSGTWSTSLSGTVCGSTQSQTLSGTVSGTVSPGGAVTLTLAISGGGGGGGGNNNPLVLTGTATSVSGSLAGTELFDNSATGSLPITATGVSSSSQTVYSGGGNGSGTLLCRSGSTSSNWTATLTATVTVSPAVPSLATSGGSVSGDWSATLSVTACSQTQTLPVSGTASGTVSPGGATTVSLTCTSGC
jgi:uncharacterized protein (TIGR03437 family)